VLFLSGPPFGAALFDEIQRRLGYGQAESVVDPAFPDRGWQEYGAALAARLARSPTVVVAHGLAVPAAIAAARSVPPVALVLMNGPLTRIDPVTAFWTRMASAPGGAAVMRAALLRPRPWLFWLASSAGLRRAVVNPYVMDRDTVATLCAPLVAAPPGRASVARWLASLSALPDPRGVECPTLLLWGDADPLYPASEASFLEASSDGVTRVSVPGGQHVHPIERPWDAADRLAAWLTGQGIQPEP
jgi:pimeloyl-ACP methyl ester carboxylesterase